MIKRKRKKRRRRTSFLSADQEEQKNQHGQTINAAINLLLPTPAQGKRTYDSRYRAVELAMLDASQLSGGSLNPDDLKRRQGVKDPIRLPVEIGRFLEKMAPTSLRLLVSYAEDLRHHWWFPKVASPARHHV